MSQVPTSSAVLQKTVGIVTLAHNNDNFGGAFQAIALQSAVESLGHTAFLMNVGTVTPQEYGFIKHITDRPKHPIRATQDYRRNRDFVPFWKAFFHEDPQGHRSFEAFVKDPTPCDVCIAGSDQVWSTAASREPARKAFYFLSFAGPQTARVAYAASFGNADPSDPSLPELLTPFKAISIREQGAAEIVAKALGREVAWVCDPTLLQTAEFWGKVANRATQRMCQHPTLWNAGYRWKTLARTKKVRKQIAKTLGLTILEPYAENLWHSCSPSPEAWLNEVRHADFVLTNSFHCTIFSILFHRPFLVQALAGKYGAMNERISSLLTRLGLEERILTTDDPDVVHRLMGASIDWDRVEARLASWRDASWQFLKDALD